MIIENDDTFIFKYDSEYLKREDKQAISLTMPLREEEYKSNILFPFFDGLIPEGLLFEIAINT